MTALRRAWTALQDSWVQTCGVGWTPRQIAVGYGFSVLFGVGVVLAAHLAGDGWTWWQAAVAGLLAWDLGGGVVGYNHPAMKRRSAAETSSLPVWHHNLQHIHPLVVVFLSSPAWLAGVASYWLVTFFVYVALLEVVPALGRRRLGPRGQRAAVVVEIGVAAALVGATWIAPDLPATARAWGVTTYLAMAVGTAVVTLVPTEFQRTTAVMCLAAVLVATPAAPAGFAWLVPVYLLKLLVGFAAREPAAPGPTAVRTAA